MNTSEIGKFFKQIRKESGMTQLDVAERLNVSPQAVSKWERSECLPDITLLPDIAAIFGIKTEDILNAGIVEKDDFEQIMSVLNAFVDDQLFSRVLEEFKTKSSLELTIPLDIFMFLNSRQKDELLDILLQSGDYEMVIDDIFQYMNNTQRARLIKDIAEKEHYESLEPLIPYMTKAIKTEVVEILLRQKAFGFLEDMLLFLNREQKDMIVQHFLQNSPDKDMLENFIPFLDAKQRKELGFY